MRPGGFGQPDAEPNDQEDQDHGCQGQQQGPLLHALWREARGWQVRGPTADRAWHSLARRGTGHSPASEGHTWASSQPPDAQAPQPPRLCSGHAVSQQLLAHLCPLNPPAQPRGPLQPGPFLGGESPGPAWPPTVAFRSVREEQAWPDSFLTLSLGPQVTCRRAWGPASGALKVRGGTHISRHRRLSRAATGPDPTFLSGWAARASQAGGCRDGVGWPGCRNNWGRLHAPWGPGTTEPAPGRLQEHAAGSSSCKRRGCL